MTDDEIALRDLMRSVEQAFGSALHLAAKAILDRMLKDKRLRSTQTSFDLEIGGLCVNAHFMITRPVMIKKPMFATKEVQRITPEEVGNMPTDIFGDTK